MKPETPGEHQKQLEEQKSSLESEQDKLRQEALKTIEPQEQQHISDQQAVLAQELKDVEAQLAATPQVTPVTPVETGIIPVVRADEGRGYSERAEYYTIEDC